MKRPSKKTKQKAKQFSLSTLQQDVQQALRQWPHAENELNYLHSWQQVQRLHNLTAQQTTMRLLKTAVTQLSREHPIEARLIRLRFIDQMVMHTVAQQLNMAESTANKKQRQAIKQLTEVLYLQEEQARQDYMLRLEKKLDLPPDIALIGVKAKFDELVKQLIQPEGRYIVSLEGLGGVGKTSLANALIRDIEFANHFYNVGWVSAKQQEYLFGMGIQPTHKPALDVETLVNTLLRQFGEDISQSQEEKIALLTQHLKSQAHFIVVDNLESIDDYQTILPTLRKLANPTKFLITTRHSLRAYTDVTCYTLEALDQENTIVFLKTEAAQLGLPQLAQAPLEVLETIYRVVGGNPLALKLVIGQISVLPLMHVLDNLKLARGKTVAELYTYIYWQAWQLLSNAGRQTLLVMPLAQNGSFDQLLQISELDIAELTQAIEELTRLSLLNVKGSLDTRRYKIHRLTETFLLTEVTKWQALS